MKLVCSGNKTERKPIFPLAKDLTGVIHRLDDTGQPCGRVIAGVAYRLIQHDLRAGGIFLPQQLGLFIQILRGPGQGLPHTRSDRLSVQIIATGPVYEIEDSREAAPGKSHTTGELAKRYIVKIKGKETYLYETSGRWFVEMKM